MRKMGKNSLWSNLLWEKKVDFPKHDVVWPKNNRNENFYFSFRFIILILFYFILSSAFVVIIIVDAKASNLIRLYYAYAAAIRSIQSVTSTSCLKWASKPISLNRLGEYCRTFSRSPFKPPNKKRERNAVFFCELTIHSSCCQNGRI